jgi:hypothetical protein
LAALAVAALVAVPVEVLDEVLDLVLEEVVEPEVEGVGVVVVVLAGVGVPLTWAIALDAAAVVPALEVEV